MKNKLSVVIITKNEEINIERCLNSVLWADEIVVVDSGSTDNTLQICKNYNCKIVKTEWLGFGLTKKLAVKSAINNWIFSIDADEEVTENLHKQIQCILEAPEVNGYNIRRSSFYLGKKINYCGWNSDYSLRLFDRRKGNFNNKLVHESVVLSGKRAKIKSPLLHYTYPTIESHLNKMNHYSSLGAKQLSAKKKKIILIEAVCRGKLKFLKMYFLQLGFLDGKTGFILSLNSGYGVFLKYLKLWQINR